MNGTNVGNEMLVLRSNPSRTVILPYLKPVGFCLERDHLGSKSLPLLRVGGLFRVSSAIDPI